MNADEGPAGTGEADPAGDLPRLAGPGRLRARTALALRRARRLAEVEPGEFALEMTTLLADANRTAGNGEAEAVTPAMVLSWETGLRVPPATVLLAAGEVAGVEVELLFHGRAVIARFLDLEEQLRRQSGQLRRLRNQLR
jgi:hypothetical protein